MEFIRVEVRPIEDGELPPVILPKAGGHRRIYVHVDKGQRFLLNIMVIGDTADGIAYGKADFQMSLEGGPEKYFKHLTPKFIEIARDRFLSEDADRIVFVAVINPVGPELRTVIG